jgi:hypothetical protein
MRRKLPYGSTERERRPKNHRRPSRNQNGSFFEEDHMTERLGRKTVLFLFLFLVLAASSLLAENIKNWAAPATWSPTKSHVGLTTMGDVTQVLPFIGLAPCRIVDTRGNGAPIQGGRFTGGSDVRNYAVSGICGIPVTAYALSLNFTVISPSAPGFLLAWPTGGAVPPVSILNFNTGDVRNNAAVVATDTFTSFTVNVSAATDVVIDINGYYYSGSSGASLPTGKYFSIIANAGPNTAAIFGQNLNATGYGVWGINFDGIGVLGNSHTYNGVWAQSNTWDALAAFGGRDGGYLQGARNGVIGATTGTGADTAGVFGIDGAGAGGPMTGFFSAGVRGEGRNGVIGITNTGGGDGVIGRANSPALVGVRADGNFTATGTKAFVEPHPSDPMLTIRYVALEGPEAGTYFRGTGRTVNREAVIPVPDSFRIVSAEEGLTVQLTPVGELAQMAVMSQDLNQIVVRSSREVTFHYHVNGIRRAFKDWQAVTEGHEFRPVSPDQKMPTYLSEEAKSRLISNGTYNPDGTVNMNTAERMGWAKVWREEAAAAAASRK